MKYITKDNFTEFLDAKGKPCYHYYKTADIPKQYSWVGSVRELIYVYRNDITKQPLCDCGKNVKFSRDKNKGYFDHCSNVCKGNDKKIRNKTTKTCLRKYGVEHSSQSENNKMKSKLTCLDRYGVEYSFQSNNNKNKSKQTLLEKYGVDHNWKVPEIRKQCKKTAKLRYGDENYNNREKAYQTKLERYGDGNYNNVNSAAISKSIARLHAQNNYKDCFLYIIEHKKLNLIKIGITGNMKNRLKGIRKEFGDECDIVEYQFIIGASDYEAFLHNKYDDKCMVQPTGAGRTEWFCSSVRGEICIDFKNIIQLCNYK